MNALDLIGTRPYKEESENQYSLRCPCHEDNNASLAIKQDGDRVLIHCFAGCLWSDVATALGGIERGSFNKGVTSPTPKVVHGPPLPPLSLDLIAPLPKAARDWLALYTRVGAADFPLRRGKGESSYPYLGQRVSGH